MSAREASGEGWEKKYERPDPIKEPEKFKEWEALYKQPDPIEYEEWVALRTLERLC